MNELVDLGFLAAKVAAIGNEKAKMAVDGMSYGMISMILRVHTDSTNVSRLKVFLPL